MSSIIKDLNDAGYTVIEFAKACNVSRNAVYQAINGENSRGLRVQIALTIGKKPSQLWQCNDTYSLECDDALFDSRLIAIKIATKSCVIVKAAL
jgi:predicted DNA-binding protein YlxM (UPF0122 family)